jgi:hypothetical protein
VKTRSTLIVVAVGLYLLGFGMLMGVVIDRMRFDRQRADVLSRYEDTLRHRMTLEKSVGGD